MTPDDWVDLICVTLPPDHGFRGPVLRDREGRCPLCALASNVSPVKAARYYGAWPLALESVFGTKEGAQDVALAADDRHFPELRARLLKHFNLKELT